MVILRKENKWRWEKTGKKIDGNEWDADLKIVFQKRPVFVVGVYGFVVRGDFQVLRGFDKQINITAFGAHSGLERYLFLDTMILTHLHDQFQILAGAQTNIAFEDAFSPAFTAKVGVTHAESPER